MALSPRDPLAFAPQVGMASAYFAAADYERALEWAEKSIRRAPNIASGHRLAAASAAHLGDLERARRIMEEAERLAPITMENFSAFYGIDDRGPALGRMGGLRASLQPRAGLLSLPVRLAKRRAADFLRRTNWPGLEP
jgi:tetratricopeptide (TPR) repeat protein